MTAQFEAWTDLMRAAHSGDETAYKRLLTELTPFLRGLAREGFRRSGMGTDEVEDVVQETLIAVHLKRHTWDSAQPLLPWVRAIARNKLIDTLRRRGRRAQVPIEDFEDILPAAETQSEGAAMDAAQMLKALPEKQRAIVTAMTMEGQSARDVAAKLGMTDVAVRVTLHRALKKLAATYRGDPQ